MTRPGANAAPVGEVEEAVVGTDPTGHLREACNREFRPSAPTTRLARRDRTSPSGTLELDSHDPTAVVEEANGGLTQKEIHARRGRRQLPEHRIKRGARDAVSVGNVGREADPAAMRRPYLRMSAHGATSIQERGQAEALDRRQRAGENGVRAEDLVGSRIRATFDQSDPRSGQCEQSRRCAARDARPDDYDIERGPGGIEAG